MAQALKMNTPGRHKGNHFKAKKAENKYIIGIDLYEVPFDAGERNMKSQSIMIVEDEVVIAKSLARDLTKIGYNVCGIAKSSDKALELADTSSPAIALMDIHLQGKKDGIETAVKLKGQYSIPCIFITGHIDADTLEKAMSTANSGLLQKPYRMSILKELIDTAMIETDRSNAEATITSASGDKRSCIRYPACIQLKEKIYIKDKKGCSLPAIIQDLSSNGVGILLDDVLIPENEYEVVIQLPTPKHGDVKGKGIVRHTTNAGAFRYYGMELVFGKRDSAVLQQYLKLREEKGLV